MLHRIQVRSKRLQSFILLASIFLALVGPSVALPVAHSAEDLGKRLTPLIEKHKGEVAVAIKNLETGESFEYRADEPMPTASLIKLPILVAAYHAIDSGRLSLEQMVTLHQDDKVPGSGILTSHFSDGAKFLLYDAIHLMITYSDNTATNLVIDQVGLSRTTELMESLGCPSTKLHSKVFLRETSIFPERSKKFGLGSTSAADMVKLLGLLQTGELVSKAASEKMLAHLHECEDRNKLPRFLPEEVKVAHKTGSVSATRCDAGIIYSPEGPLAVCVLTTRNEDRRWASDNEAGLLCAQVAKRAYDYFNEDKKPDTTAGPASLKSGDSGLLVEALQRTLNARMKKPRDIGVDGDFGPQTEAAVVAFQIENQIEQNGEVGPETWAALGPLMSEGPKVADPAVINAIKITKQPMDELDGPPFVTCKAWAVGDGKTGEFLWGFNENESRDFASTTKIMTGYLVTSLAEKTPEVLDETVVFSETADNTVGSTAGVRAGEKLSVRELLYGLLLPSGNDASVALGEHFGDRLGEGKGKGEYEHFIGAMNRTAQKLGMESSHFVNTHGLPAAGHVSSANDLMILAYNSMQQPLFRQYVSTVQHGCTVVGPTGNLRNLRWGNTNRLLKIEGYDGVKTGTTNAAGSCLVSHGHRGDRSLIVVVLGATSSDARYVDTRNLFRWSWNQLNESDSPFK